MQVRRAVVAATVLCVLAGCTTQSETDASKEDSTGTPTATTRPDRDVEIFLLTKSRRGSGVTDQITSVTVSTHDSGDVGLDVVRALFAANPKLRWLANGFNYFTSIEPSPITTVRSVTADSGLITVDVIRDIMDPYPTVDCDCPFGDIVMQQLVWTLQTALHSHDPVALTVNGEPAAGIWGMHLNGPVRADPPVGIRTIGPETSAGTLID